MPHVYDILIVDDISDNIRVAISILKPQGYNFSYALSGKEALGVLNSKKFDLILLDVMMPDMDGFEVCEVIKKNPLLREIPIIFLTAKVDVKSIEKGFNLGAVDYVTKPFHSEELKVRVKSHLELYHAKQQLQRHNISLNNTIQDNDERHFTELEIAQKELIFVLSQLMESRSTETASHVHRVADICVLLAKLDGRLDQDEIDILYLAAPLHDIGKILIDDSILHKHGSLTKDEFNTMKNHVTFAHEVLNQSKTKLMQSAASIAHEHHENYDGSGYPLGIKGEDINLYGRIVSMADVLDALTHKRAYKAAWSFERTTDFIVENRGVKFDPKLVDVFLDNKNEFEEILKG